MKMLFDSCYMWLVSRLVPPRSVPTQTLQRANGQQLDGLRDGAENYLNEGSTVSDGSLYTPLPLHLTLRFFSFKRPLENVMKKNPPIWVWFC